MKTRLWALLLALALAAVRGGLRRRRGGAGRRRRRGTRPAEVEQFPAGSTMGKIQEAGEIKIGVKYDVPPFGFKNPQNDEIEGFDVDFGKAIADKLGVEPKFVEAISDNRIPFLQDGTVDLVLSTMTINAERAQEIEFSEPYYIARGRILVPQDSDITGVDDLAGKQGLHGARLDVRGDAEGAGAGGRPAARRHLLGVPRAGAERRRRRGLDRRRDPHRHDHPGRHAQAHRGRAADHRAVRRRHQEGRRRSSRSSSTACSRSTSPAAAGPRPTRSGSASTPDEQQEPPTMTLEEAIEATS